MRNAPLFAKKQYEQINNNNKTKLSSKNDIIINTSNTINDNISQL